MMYDENVEKKKLNEKRGFRAGGYLFSLGVVLPPKIRGKKKILAARSVYLCVRYGCHYL